MDHAYVHTVKRGETRGAQTAGLVSLNHGVFLLGCIAQASAPVGLHNGFIHRCHRSVNYDSWGVWSNVGELFPRIDNLRNRTIRNGTSAKRHVRLAGFSQVQGCSIVEKPLLLHFPNRLAQPMLLVLAWDVHFNNIFSDHQFSIIRRVFKVPIFQKSCQLQNFLVT